MLKPILVRTNSVESEKQNDSAKERPAWPSTWPLTLVSLVVNALLLLAVVSLAKGRVAIEEQQLLNNAPGPPCLPNAKLHLMSPPPPPPPPPSPSPTSPASPTSPPPSPSPPLTPPPLALAAQYTAIVVDERCSFYHYSTQDEQRQMRDRIVNEARERAGLAPLKPGLGAANMEKFFHIHHGHEVCDGATYRRVWKGGNNFIRFNMRKSCSSPLTESWTVPESSNFTFSFVRDPFSHFVSGYREATMRTFKDCCDVAADGRNVTFHDKSIKAKHSPMWTAATCKYSCEDFVGVERTTRLAKTYLRDLLDGRLLEENRHFWHVALMAANLFARAGDHYSPLDFVGTLENIEADWARMCEEHECPPHLQSYQDFDTKMGQHEQSSADTFGHGAGLARAFTEEPQLAAAVRRLISLDEDCFHDVLGRGARHRRQLGEVELPAWLDA